MNLPTVPTIQEQTGWKRSTPVAICQDFDVLLRVRAWDFDLENAAFLDYADARGVLYKAGSIGSPRFLFTANHSATEADFRANPHFQRAIPSSQYPDGYKYSDEEMDSHWRIMRAAKGALQDAWELFTQAAA